MKILTEHEYYNRLRTIQGKVSWTFLDNSIAEADRCVIIAEMKLLLFIGTNYQSIYIDAWLSSLRLKSVSLK
ncbi:hypothetical protein [Escherichia phage vB_EcoM_CRJP21]|uniref:Uncharacterized protein n=1 Tax=Escherichia phage 121Q TaxID=1555202 RepID=A0A097EXT4_9CAUD|nr:hypothetical protein PBI_121Q_328 [Escherichia phage 121Q]AIT14218.1 hypothetical protein PBI_121Q_328 [Escherichia phage 121Q]WIL00580.1 hypothetical protein [Escherichia phage vB_EcoM_CRJP21]